MRLNGWQRIGIVVSMAWALGGGLWGNEVGISQEDWVTSAYATCLKSRSIQADGSIPRDTDWAPCKRQFDKDYAPAISAHWIYAAIFAFLPIILGWIGAYAILKIARWVRAGFETDAET